MCVFEESIFSKLEVRPILGILGSGFLELLLELVLPHVCQNVKPFSLHLVFSEVFVHYYFKLREVVSQSDFISVSKVIS